jgi:uncharacterized protein YndB with AHSA1/START domain
MFARKQRAFAASVTVSAPVETVWQTLLDPAAIHWIASGDVFSVPVPGGPETVGALRCAWRLMPKGIVGCLVFEVAEADPLKTVTYVERQKPPGFDSRITFRLAPEGGGTQVGITFSDRRYRYEWSAGQRSASTYPGRLAAGLEAALRGETPRPADAASLVVAPDGEIRTEAFDIEIAGGEEVIWRYVEDETGVLIPDPRTLRQWPLREADKEFWIALRRMPDGRLFCHLSQIIRHGPRQVTQKMFALSATHELIPGNGACTVRVTYSWDPGRLRRDAVATDAAAWLANIKAAAEADATGLPSHPEQEPG